ncbi:MAG: LuxR C-terminal-related transcriptional regulator [Anaerolineales bacterium]
MDIIRIAIIAPNPLARIGLLALLSIAETLDIVADAAGTDTLATDVVDALLWDFSWDTAESIDALRSLNEGDSTPPILGLLADEADAAEILAAGADGVLAGGAEAEQIISGLHAVARGLVVLDGDFALPTMLPAPEPIAEPLTPREHEVLQLLAAGLPNKGIARQLAISDHTAKFHVNAILKKLDAQSRTEAVVRATKLGLIVL